MPRCGSTRKNVSLKQGSLRVALSPPAAPRRKSKAQRATHQEQHEECFSSSLFSHVSPNDFSCPYQHVGRNSYLDLLRRLEIDYQLELRRLLHRQVGRLCAFQDFVHVCSGAPPVILVVRRVAHKPSCLDPFRRYVHRREMALSREIHDSLSVGTSDRIS